MIDMGLVRGAITILTFLAFIGVCWWAYRPSSRKRFEADALLPFEDLETVLDPSHNDSKTGDFE